MDSLDNWTFKEYCKVFLIVILPFLVITCLFGAILYAIGTYISKVLMYVILIPGVFSLGWGILVWINHVCSNEKISKWLNN